MKRAVLTVTALLALTAGAQARPTHHHYVRHHSYRSTANYPGVCEGLARQGVPCGCYSSVYFFGRDIPELNLAWNWARKFPHVAPAPGTAQVFAHHVRPVLAVDPKRGVLVHDAWKDHWVSASGVFVQPPHSGGFEAPTLLASMKTPHRHQVRYAMHRHRHYRRYASR